MVNHDDSNKDSPGTVDDCADAGTGEGTCNCKKKCLTNAEYLYERFKSEGLIDKLKEKRENEKKEVT